ncbi:autotransporter outer membrane beta-barrel domain-containing protein, partial [Verrucomicrobium sp. BvORR034]|uniref:autotransporter outer membrane beta-barrel domain-containing protein n=1 Tax=Verrucomicrobium sp. BvORR034 TaxID=1396418 RepID=UPI002240ECE8
GGTTDYSIVRPLSWASLDRTARSNPDAAEFFSLIGTGYDFQFGNFTVGPQLSAQYTHLEMDGVKETGAGVLNLGLDDSTSESFRTYLGGRLAYTLHASETVTIIPELRVFWQHEFLQDDETLHARLDGGRGPGFEYRSSNNDRDAVFVGAGVGVQVGTELYFNVYYNADFGRGDDGNHAVSASMNFKF